MRAQPTSPIEYDGAAATGAVRIARRAGETHIVIRAAAPLVWNGAVVLAAGILLLAGTLAWRFYRASPYAMWWMVFAITGLGWAIFGVRMLLSGARSRTLLATGDSLTLLGRSETRVVRVNWSSEDLAEVRVEPVSRWRTVIKATRVLSVGVYGDRHEICTLRPDESHLVRAAIAEQLDVPRAASPERGLARLRWCSCIQTRHDPFGLLIRRPPPVPWVTLFCTAALVPAVMIAVWREKFGRNVTWDRMIDDPSGLVAGIGVLIAGLCAAAVVNKLRRSAEIHLNPAFLSLEETSVLRPAYEEWSVNEIEGFALRSGRWRRVSIDMLLAGGRHALLLANLNRRDAVPLIRELEDALRRARSTDSDD